MTTSVALLASLDTKAEDADYIRERLHSHGLHVVTIDVGVLGEPATETSITREMVAEAAGCDLATLRRRSDRGEAVEVMGRGARSIVHELCEQSAVHGVFALGGGAGTTIGSVAMRDLPLGLPKAILTTIAAGNTANYIGTSDIVLYPSIVDVAGVNRISAVTYTRAADAFAGMVTGATEHADSVRTDRKLIAATMFGVTTPAVMHARTLLENAGHEVIVFHATGTGGRSMERLIAEGYFDAVLDLTTTEWSDQVVGGILPAGPTRLGAAAAAGIPAVVSLGATDIVNFGPVKNIPSEFVGRKLYQHNAENTLMRVTEDEADTIGYSIGTQLATSTGPCIVVVPTQGTSALDRAGQPFDDPAARRVLSDAVKRAAETDSSVRFVDVDHHINDEEFAAAAARHLLNLLDKPSTPTLSE